MEENTQENPTTIESNDTSQAVQEARPEWLPEKFKSGEDLAKAYGELETWRLKTKDEALELFKQEAAKEVESSVNLPSEANKYQFKYDESIMPNTADGTKLVITEDGIKDDPMLGWWRQHCFDNKLPQETFETGITAFIKADLETVPTYDEEISKLGERGDERFKSVINWMNGNLSIKSVDTMNKSQMSAEWVEAMEEISSLNRSSVPESTNTTSSQSSLVYDDLKKMQSEPGYINGTDASLIAKVQAGYEKLTQQSG